MNRLRQILRPNHRAAREVGCRAGDLQNSVVGPRRKLQPFHSRFQQGNARRVEGAHLAHHAAGHLGVAKNALQILEPLGLHFAGSDDAGEDFDAPDFGSLAARQLVVADGRDLHVQVNSVEQRPRNLGDIAFYDARAADALLVRVVVVAAGAWVRCILALFWIRSNR